jgi:hypothetical protein
VIEKAKSLDMDAVRKEIQSQQQGGEAASA